MRQPNLAMQGSTRNLQLQWAGVSSRAVGIWNEETSSYFQSPATSQWLFWQYLGIQQLPLPLRQSRSLECAGEEHSEGNGSRGSHEEQALGERLQRELPGKKPIPYQQLVDAPALLPALQHLLCTGCAQQCPCSSCSNSLLRGGMLCSQEQHLDCIGNSSWVWFFLTWAICELSFGF